MEPSSIEVCVGSFVAPGEEHWRWLDRADLERIDIEELAAQGIFLDPFDVRPLAKRTRFRVAGIPKWPEGANPFMVTPVVVQGGTVEEELLVEWSEADRKAAAAFEAAARPKPGFLELHSPFRVTVTA